MDSKQFHRRVWAIVVLLALMVTGMSATLYDLQVNQGDNFYQQSQFKIAETQTVEAARGQILDRNGQVLVSNYVVYQVTLDTAPMGEDRNQILLELTNVARDSGVTWTDTLSISPSAPFSFTTANPYYTITQDEGGNQSISMTRLGRLAVKMRWIKQPVLESDSQPDKEPEVILEQPGLWDRIQAFFTGEELTLEVLPTKEEQPYTLPSAQELLDLMAQSFSLPEDLSPNDRRAVCGLLYELYLRSKEITWNPYVFAEDVDIAFISRVKERSLNGVVIEATTLRRYNTPYAAHILGRVADMSPEEVSYYTSLDEDQDGTPDYEMNDKVGKEGVERVFESYLRGTPGVRKVERNTDGKIVSETWVSEPQPGDNVVLTLDIGLQGHVENTLATALPNLVSKEAEGAACVVLDVNNADVLASASYPTFSLATYGADYTENAQDPLKPLFNRALMGAYAPGSTFKMVTGIAGLEEGLITPTTKIRDEGRYTYYPGTAPQCWSFRQYGYTHGLVNVSKAIEVSCNYFFFDVGRRLGIDRLGDYASRFGLGQKTGLELPEAEGVMAGPEYTRSVGGTWYEGSTLSVSIGQESSQFTPIQLANYIATLVNGGTRNATHLLKEIKSSDFSQILETYQAQPLSTIELQDQNLNAVKAGMLSLTTEGSVARFFRDLDVQVGAKTGSAQVSSQTESNAVFVCFAPFDDPEIAVAIVVEHGGSGSELGAMAADILSYYFSSQETREEVLQENTIIR